MTRDRPPRQIVRATVPIEMIAVATNLSPRSVKRAIRELVALGVLSCTGPDEFSIHLDALAAMPRISETDRA